MGSRGIQTKRRVAVAVAGAGPVGLALAVELGMRGVPCVIAEQRERTRLVPRAKLANVRTMEHMRRWGIADRVRAASPLPATFSTDVSFVTSLTGHELARFENVFFTRHERDDRFAEPAQQIPQYALEPVLRKRAEHFPSVRFLDGWRVESFHDAGEYVEVTIQRAGGASQVIEAEFLVGCDGAASVVREHLGINMKGRRGIARNYGVVFRSLEVNQILPFSPALHFWTVNAATPSYMGPGDQSGLWWLQATAIDSSVDMRALDPLQVVRGAVGRDIPAEIINVDPWETHSLAADRVQKGRVFLAGDAAHLHSPMGAHGMNQGITDAVDLGWKLWAVLEGWAHTSLLASYSAERGPLHERIVDEATHNYGTLANHFVRDGLDEVGVEGDRLRAAVGERIRREKHREFYSLGLVLGHVYEGSPVIVSDATPAPEPQVESFTPTAYPGGRAPHAWLSDEVSLFDHFGKGMTLLRLDESVDCTAIKEHASRRRLPLDIVTVDQPALRDLYESRLALIRPDQVVAWRGECLPADPGAILDIVTGRPVPSASLVRE